MDNLYLRRPADFSAATYRKINKDLCEYNDMESLVHYIVFGRKEGRFYNFKQLIPPDFFYESYIEYNPDLSGMTRMQLEEHYVIHGKKEGRLYTVALPEDFNIDVYRYRNSDISDQTNGWLKGHYFQHGQYENRVCSDQLFDKDFFCSHNNIPATSNYGDYLKDITQIKSKEVFDIVENIPNLSDHLLLVSHDNSIYGATHYLYLLYDYLKQRNFKLKLLDLNPNPMLKEKYSVSDSDVIYYKQDPTLLYYFCVKSNAKKIYFNSVNFAMAAVAKYIDRKKLIIHSHEIREHYYCDLDPDFVVSKIIAEQYAPLPKVQPPIISKETLDLMDLEFYKPATAQNNFGEIKSDKITIGMCGSLSDRKNYKLFLDLAKNLKQFNFLWVGGGFDVGGEIENFYHVKNVELPYKYYNLMDYFILCSTADPCPYVVLENLYLGNRVLTFEKNIYTRHDRAILQGQLFEFPYEINYNNAYSHIISTCTSKKESKPLKVGRDYVLQHYAGFSPEFINFLS
jgi:hypothetical protein